MQELVWFRSHVERLLQHMWGPAAVSADPDGDYPFRYGRAACWVRVEPGSPMSVRVTGHAAYGVKRSAKLLVELNDISSRSRFTSVLWAGGVVVCEYALPADAANAETLEMACGMVGAQANDLGPLLAAVYGGSTPFEAEEAQEDAPGMVRAERGFAERRRPIRLVWASTKWSLSARHAGVSC